MTHCWAILGLPTRGQWNTSLHFYSTISPRWLQSLQWDALMSIGEQGREGPCKVESSPLLEAGSSILAPRPSNPLLKTSRDGDTCPLIVQMGENEAQGVTALGSPGKSIAEPGGQEKWRELPSPKALKYYSPLMLLPWHFPLHGA